MLQQPAPARSPGSQEDPARPRTPAMPPPESPSESQQPSPDQSPPEQAREEEFQFLGCQRCQAEAKCPKLLLCLHTLCSGCLEASGMKCHICQAPAPASAPASAPAQASASLPAPVPAVDNIFFESLQRRLSVHRQIVDARATCTRCREPADFWCFECEQLLCAKCFEAHQWFLKHEARPLAELRSQSVSQFLDSTRKSNNIFCSNPNHRSPTLTSIYCRGCSKPLCCTCALLDSSHGDLKCDIAAEIQQRQEELDAVMEALQKQEHAFDLVQARMRAAVSQLMRVRTDTEELTRTRMRQLVAFVQAREREMLEEVNTRYQREYEKIADRLGCLEAVLQRIRMGSLLVQRMKRYASDQEVLDLYSFLCEALRHLRQEEPQSLQAALRTDIFEEFNVNLQNLASSINRWIDAAVPRRTSAEAAGTPREPSDNDLTAGPPVAQAQAPGLAEAQPGAVVQSTPGVYPVPLYAYSIKDPSCREEVSTTPQKRKCCQTEYPRKAIKMESEEEREARLSQSSPEQPRPSTSRAVSPPPLEGCPSPVSHSTGNDQLLLNSNHKAGDCGEAAERVVVISSSEDSDAENSSLRELDDSSSESSDLQLEGPSSLRVLEESLVDLPSEDRPLVFFDLKIDNETQKIRQLAAVNQESKFRVHIQPEAFSVSSKAVSLDAGLQHFLNFLNSMRRPILACYRLWGPSLPNFFQALEDMNRLWDFQDAISGFLAVLPLIQEHVPQASSFRLKSLAKTYLARNMSEHSALATVLTLRDLCRLLEVSPGPGLAQHLYSVSSLQCFGSLQPLVQAGILPRAEARLLALHNVSFLELLTAHRRDPQGGLRKYGRYLQGGALVPGQPVLNLQALSTYFKGISSPLASQGAGKRASQQS